MLPLRLYSQKLSKPATFVTLRYVHCMTYRLRHTYGLGTTSVSHQEVTVFYTRKLLLYFIHLHLEVNC